MRLFNVVLLSFIFLSTDSKAANDELYYAIGGGQAVANAASNRSHTFALGAGASWNSNLTCGNFDMALSIENQLNGIQGEFQNLMGSVIESASGVVASLPAMAIQRLNPALYDLLQNGVLQATEEFNVSVASCEELVSDVMNDNDTDVWRQFANAEFIRFEGSSGTADPLEAQERIEAGEAQDSGVTWIGGVRHGGASQPAIEIVGDTIRSGYNLQLNRAPTNTTSMIGECRDAPLCQVFDSPSGQAQWAIQVLGERKVRTCKDCTPMENQSGMGLASALEQQKNDIETKLSILVASGEAPSQEQLAEVSGGPSLKVTRRVIEAIRQEKKTEQAVIVKRLASEMATNRVMEYALMTRRALLAGMTEPNIASYPVAVEHINKKVDELHAEIENMVFEMRVRASLAGNMTQTLLQRSNARYSVPLMEERLRSNMEAGGVVRE